MKSTNAALTAPKSLLDASMIIPTINHKIQDDFHLKSGELHAFLNPYSYVLLRNHLDLLLQFENIHFDGIALCKIYQWFGLKKVVRRSFDMTSIARDVFQEASRTSKSVVIVGTEKGLIDEAVEKLRNEFSVNISLSRHGYFQSEEEIFAFQEEILKVDPDIVIVGMGAVRQERFLVQLREIGWEGTGFTCGGFLHQTADRLEYYPKFLDAMNLRWAYRIWKDPYVIRRYLVDYPKFLLCFVKDYAFWRKTLNQGDRAKVS